MLFLFNFFSFPTPNESLKTIPRGITQIFRRCFSKCFHFSTGINEINRERRWSTFFFFHYCCSVHLCWPQIVNNNNKKKNEKKKKMHPNDIFLMPKWINKSTFKKKVKRPSKNREGEKMNIKDSSKRYIFMAAVCIHHSIPDIKQLCYLI